MKAQCVWGNCGQIRWKNGEKLDFWVRIFIFAEGKNENACLIFDFWLLGESQWLLQWLIESYKVNKTHFGCIRHPQRTISYHINVEKRVETNVLSTFWLFTPKSHLPEVTKMCFIGTACHYPTTLVISGDPEKLIENKLFVIKNWPEIDKIEKLTFFKKSS